MSTVQLRCLIDHAGRVEAQDFALQAVSTGSSELTIDSYQTLFHSVKLHVVPRKRLPKDYTAQFHLSVSIAPDYGTPQDNLLEENDRQVLDLMQEPSYVHLEGLEESALILGTCTSSIVLRSGSSACTTSSETESSESRTFDDTLPDALNPLLTETHTEVSLYPPQDAIGGDVSYIRIHERPSMHAIGDRLWHSSIVLASYILNGHTEGPTSTSTTVLELGAGCGLASLAYAQSLLNRTAKTLTRIVATDLPEIVDSTLKSSLQANPTLARSIEAESLMWGEELHCDFSSDADGHLIVLASDVLYNPSSHEIFLRTLLALRDRCKGSMKVFIAYKHRTEGDGDFFQRSAQQNMPFERVYRVANVELRRYSTCNPPS